MCNRAKLLPLCRFGEMIPKDQSGAAAVEFAIVATPLIAIVMMAVQTTIILFFDQALQTVTNQSTRSLMVGSAQISNMNQNQFHQLVCSKAPPIFNCPGIMVDVQSAGQFSQLNTAPLIPTYDPQGQVQNNWNYSPGGAGSIVIVRVMYMWPVFGGILGSTLADQPNGNHLMVGTSVVKIEPYQ